VPLRDNVYQTLSDQIIAGKFLPGTRLRDFAVAATLNVSRTPVREALVRLAHDGWVHADAGRGFTVRALTAQEISDGYPILWTLECLALKSTVDFTEEQVRELRNINQQIGESGGSATNRVSLDETFHQVLLAGCQNPLLLKTIKSVKRPLQVYEFAYNALQPTTTSSREHNAIIKAVARGDRDEAASALEHNWRGTRDLLVAWFAQRQ
jgi:DNA-binding GntR family transcriptional regulator